MTIKNYLPIVISCISAIIIMLVRYLADTPP
uniref:Holin n=1 Tax=Heterorhabditis bacteriophora TaxID=37862 RepID=A0A1I7WHG8_HETBA